VWTQRQIPLSLWKNKFAVSGRHFGPPPPFPTPSFLASPFHDCFSQTGAESTSAPGRLLFGPWFFVSNVLFLFIFNFFWGQFCDVVAKMAMTIYRKFSQIWLQYINL
jgi:hypothetical protein